MLSMRFEKTVRLRLLVLGLCLLWGIAFCVAQKIERSDYFYVLNSSHGLSDNNILQMLQLPSGHLAVRTQRGINVYDGHRFRFVSLPREKAQPLPQYDGQTHLYADNQERLWVKDFRQVYCIDLQKKTLLAHPLDAYATRIKGATIGDLFVDCKGWLWVVTGDSVINTSDGSSIQLNPSWGSLQDLDTDGKRVYAFLSSGRVAAFRDGKLDYTLSAYSSAEAQNYRYTSLTVQTPGGQFYQIRTGKDAKTRQNRSVFLHFDPETRRYSKVFSCDYLLHTLNMSSDNQALISSPHGYLMFDFKVSDKPREVSTLSLPDGRSLTTGINTVYRDREGCIWLGTYNDGLICVSPLLGLFFTAEKPWWQSGWGAVLLVVLLVVSVAIFARYRRKRKESDAVSIVEAETVETTEDTEPEPELIAKARILVEKHLQDGEYGVEQLAAELCMERTGLYKKLTALTGTTPVAFIRQIRLRNAALLLKEGHLTVNEIAEKTGFSSPSYFTKCFKKQYGVLPSEFK